VMATARTYNDASAGTYGQFIPGLAGATAATTGQQTRLIQLGHSATPGVGTRTNLGLVNTTATPTTVEVKLYTSDGTLLGTRSYALGAFGYLQDDGVFGKVTAADVADGFAVLRTVTPGGAFLAYASVIDNRSGDPVYVPARMP
jgi:hypothetical protein